jgi:hypothetical protein
VAGRRVEAISASGGLPDGPKSVDVMPDKPVIKDLDAVLTKLEREWQELVSLLKSRVSPETKVIEAEKILLRDATGTYRGRISVAENDSAGLSLTDREGKTWARLGINQDGEAFLELKDKHGTISYRVPEAPITPKPNLEPSGAPVSDLEPPGVMLPPIVFASTVSEEEGAAEPSVGPEPQTPPESGPDLVGDRLEKLERQYRRQRLFDWLIIGVLVALLAAQGFLLSRFYFGWGRLKVESLAVQDRHGKLRAWLGEENGRVHLNLWGQKGRYHATLGLGTGGTPDLTIYDRSWPRAELNLGTNGKAHVKIWPKLNLNGRREVNAPRDPDNQAAQTGVTAGSEADTVSSALALQKEMARDRVTEASAVYVGSKTSNKYHYPGCKWAKQIRPERLIRFKSAKEAQERHYIPCPVCKPPRAD